MTEFLVLPLPDCRKTFSAALKTHRALVGGPSAAPRQDSEPSMSLTNIERFSRPRQRGALLTPSYGMLVAALVTTKVNVACHPFRASVVNLRLSILPNPRKRGGSAINNRSFVHRFVNERPRIFSPAARFSLMKQPGRCSRPSPSSQLCVINLSPGNVPKTTSDNSSLTPPSHTRLARNPACELTMVFFNFSPTTSWFVPVSVRVPVSLPYTNSPPYLYDSN